MNINAQILGLMMLAAPTILSAEPVNIVAAEFSASGQNTWSVKVTLQHPDTGWDHYADGWRVVDAKNNVLGDRVLFHPHVNEQPFTRGLGGVIIPSSETLVFIEAHDKVSGWTESRLRVDLSDAIDGHLKVLAQP